VESYYDKTTTASFGAIPATFTLSDSEFSTGIMAKMVCTCQ
jgi:hypothetical protein